ncbi:MAG: pilus assembly protein PilM [Lachnospiraceae bacterium]|nr:pilus assembly protein PilM [Lachnospiraceae bacterium]
MASKVLSIEVGYALTKICEVDYKTSNSKVYHCFSIVTPEGVLEDGYIRLTDIFSKCLMEEIKQRGIKTKQVVFTISSSKIANREVFIPFVKENRISSLIEANANEYFPVDVSGYQLAYNILDIVEEAGVKKYKLLVLAAPKDLLESYYVLAEKSQLSIAALDYSGNSIVPIVRAVGADEVTMVIKVDERSSLLTIFKEQSIVLQRNVAYGTDLAIETLMESQSYSEVQDYREALQILRSKMCIRKSFDPEASDESDIASDGEERKTTRIEVTESLKMLVGSIVRVIDYYNSRNNDGQIQHFYVTGLGGDFVGLNQLLSTEIGAPVKSITRVEGINLDKLVNKEKLSFGEYLACIGAAIAPLDFIPNEHKSKKKSIKARKNGNVSINAAQISVIVLVTGVVIAAALAAVSVTQYIFTNSENGALKVKETQLLPYEVVYNDFVVTKGTYDDVNNMTESIKVNNDSLPAFIKELEAKMPSQINFLSFTSDASTVTINMKVDSKESAAVVLAELRSFESLTSAQTNQINEVTDELGVTSVDFTVTCNYKSLVSGNAISSNQAAE